MKLRKLNKEEHNKTRMLWEQIFQEDSQEFLDYYYSYKTRINDIYVVENEDTICAMLQLNPYEVHMGLNEVRNIHYIVGVATAQEYRKQGLMRKLLHKSMQDMRDRGEPFVYLMPAAEAIYKPFDFRFIYDQNKLTLTKEERSELENNLHASYLSRIDNKTEICMESSLSCKDQGEVLTIQEASLENMEELVTFSEDLLKKEYQLYMKRDVPYYTTLYHEQKCQNGGILLFYWGKQLVGYAFYEMYETISVRELVLEKPYIQSGFAALFAYFSTEDRKMIITAFDSTAKIKESSVEAKPIIMARVLNLKEMVKTLTSSSKICFTLGISDNILAENNGCYHWEIDEKGGKILPVMSAEQNNVQEKLNAAELEVEEIPCLEIHELTSFLFGYKSLEEIIEIEKYQALKKMKKINILKKVFINEIV